MNGIPDIQRHQGFTLVELVMVIVLLGILAATALPRFADLGNDANEQVFQAVKSNFKTGIRVVHSKSLLHRNGGSYPDVNLEGTCIKVDPASGFPVVNQNSGTCTPVADVGTPLPSHVQLLRQLYAWVHGKAGMKGAPARLPGIGPAWAAPPPPPPPPPAASSLPAKLMDGDFTGWTWTESPPLGTLTSPEGRAFTYNQNTGNVN